MALDNNYLLFSQQPPLLHNPLLSFGLADVQYHHHLDSPMSSEASSGYLEDAVAQWSERCKRRKLASSPCDAVPFMTEDIQGILQWQGLLDSSCYGGDPLGDLNCLVHEDNSNDVSGDTNQNSTSVQGLQQDIDIPSPPSSSQMEPTHEDKDDPPTSTTKALASLRDRELDESKEQEKAKISKKKKKILYPFEVVKPVGLEGGVTLDDINERILMRPTRPVKHPVGEFALRPCVAADGLGLSGKAVVGLARFHTQGRGTITIIRTRG